MSRDGLIFHLEWLLAKGLFWSGFGFDEIAGKPYENPAFRRLNRNWTTWNRSKPCEHPRDSPQGHRRCAAENSRVNRSEYATDLVAKTTTLQLYIEAKTS